jgi:DNA polymerase-3 subunit alpha
MGKKKPEEMAKQRDRFVSGAVERGNDRAAAAKVFDLIAEFAEYGFAKSHSTAYALITYQTAYCKANHPREYLAALLTVESGNHDKLARYIGHAREKGIEIAPPDVNESARDFTVVEDVIRFGLAGIKNVGEGAIEAILAARNDGLFTSLFDFSERVDARRVNRRVVESLVKGGAFDRGSTGLSSAGPRRSAIARSDRRVSSVVSRARDRAGPSRSCPTCRPGPIASGSSTRRSCSAST